MSPLASLIRQEIETGGPIPLARFMELALYHPAWGYYEQAPRRIGAQGDYYTSVSVGRLFGELLAFRFAEWCERWGQGALQWVEGGAHDARLARDILGWLREWRPAVFARLEYWLVEPSAQRQAQQRTTLGELAGRVRWLRGWNELPAQAIRGVIFANELLDAMPLRRFVWDARERRWAEVGVGVANDRFCWVRLEPGRGREAGLGGNDGALSATFTLTPELLAVLPDGFVLEVCPEAVAWWAAAARSLQAGWLLTFDYGFAAEDFLSPERAAGTLRAYRGHAVTGQVLECPGEQDLTAHVNFSAIRAAGEAAGLVTEHCESQADFVLRVVREVERAGAGFPTWTAERRRQLQTLVHPDHLGRALRVLAQRRAPPSDRAPI